MQLFSLIFLLLFFPQITGRAVGIEHYGYNETHKQQDSDVESQSRNLGAAYYLYGTVERSTAVGREWCEIYETGSWHDIAVNDVVRVLGVGIDAEVLELLVVVILLHLQECLLANLVDYSHDNFILFQSCLVASVGKGVFGYICIVAE